MRTVRVGGLFSGIGAHASACDRLADAWPDVEFKVVFQGEFHAQTASAYDLMHGKTINLGDVSKIKGLNGPLAVDVLFWTPPCQDISRAGPENGASKGSGTRSALMFEVPRILAGTRPTDYPKYLVFEEVPTIQSKYKDVLEQLMAELSALGYCHSMRVVNASNHGQPQNRRRLIMISKLGRDVPDVPIGEPTPLRFKDVMESEPVEDKYYLSEKQVLAFRAHNETQARQGRYFAYNPTDIRVNGGGYAKTVASRTLRETDNYPIVPLVLAGDLNRPNYLEWHNRVYDTAGACPTVPVCGGGGTHPQFIIQEPNGLYRIRRITEREAFRLMGFNDAEFDKLAGSYCMTALYRFAGNSVCVGVFTDVLRAIVEDIRKEI